VRKTVIPEVLIALTLSACGGSDNDRAGEDSIEIVQR
jgi:hypothetical protein